MTIYKFNNKSELEKLLNVLADKFVNKAKPEITTREKFIYNRLNLIYFTKY